MKYALALSLPLYLSCAAQQVSSPAVIKIEPSSTFMDEEEQIFSPRERPFRKEMRFVMGSFRQMMRQQNKKTLEGVLSFEESTESFDYSYDTSTFCDLDTRDKFNGKISLEFSQIRGIQGRYKTTTVILTDLPPFGSADKIEIRVDGLAQNPIYAVYNIDSKAQQFYESLIRKLSEEFGKHDAQHHSWKDFQFMRATNDEQRKIHQAYKKVTQMLKNNNPISLKKIHIYNPCE